MNFVQTDLETTLSYLNQLDPSAKPLWGTMVPQRMVEHLSETIRMSFSEKRLPLHIPEDKIEQMVKVLFSDEPIPKNFKVPGAPEGHVVRNENIKIAIEEFKNSWLAYEKYFQEKPTAKILHPMYGDLDKKGWDRMHAKHFTHHFQQFGLV